MNKHLEKKGKKKLFESIVISRVEQMQYRGIESSRLYPYWLDWLTRLSAYITTVNYLSVACS